MAQTRSGKRYCRREPAPAAPAAAPAIAAFVAAPSAAAAPAVPLAVDPSPPPPPPLLDLLERHPILFAQEVLARLPLVDRTSLTGAGLVWRDAVFLISIFPEGLLRAETPGAARIFIR